VFFGVRRVNSWIASRLKPKSIREIETTRRLPLTSDYRLPTSDPELICSSIAVKVTAVASES
jgi:hypothetical protein